MNHKRDVYWDELRHPIFQDNAYLSSGDSEMHLFDHGSA